MMLGETQPGNRTVHVPRWPEMLSPYKGNAHSLQEQSEWEVPSEDAYSCDQFRMFEFKVRRCARGRSHDWTECPYAHPGEKARRRDPRKYHYCGTACPDFRKGCCKKGDACEYAHGVFECWLHPSRYRTQPCKDGTTCLRRVCFFAHTPHQLRLLPLSPSPPSPFVSSPDSPPMSPITLSGSVSDMVSSLRSLQLNSLPNLIIRPGFFSLPSTPTPAADLNYFDLTCVEEPVMERVESGRNIRTRMFQKLSKENSLDGSGSCALPDPDVDWVSELVTR